ncbi:unnamed protein product [Eruca vesicaria subsp. sativa]|uniref:Uncharacterized protein n=1 Tax=Eruca vesicaria subsp. sativa TaxID=29727 RepID=A0ABC8LKR2_ERUVS|nr:unnamed protein product [Eruca vesicaria subsp. sativa]
MEGSSSARTYVMKVALGHSASNEIRNAIFKASKLFHGEARLLITDMPNKKLKRTSVLECHIRDTYLFAKETNAWRATMTRYTLHMHWEGHWYQDGQRLQVYKESKKLQ